VTSVRNPTVIHSFIHLSSFILSTKFFQQLICYFDYRNKEGEVYTFLRRNIVGENYTSERGGVVTGRTVSEALPALPFD